MVVAASTFLTRRRSANVFVRDAKISGAPTGYLGQPMNLRVILFGVSAVVFVSAGCASVKPGAGGTAGGGAGGTGGGIDAGTSSGTGGSTGPIVRLDAGMPPGCGNGQRTRDEACDDGNTVSGDGCAAD